MTYKEAKETLDMAIEVARDEMAVALLMAKQAVEKQIPKKPVDITVRGLDSNMISGRCPKCNTRQSYGSRKWHEWFNKRCYECGQALDWSEGAETYDPV